jgi:N-formylglutamate amidohydrolase
VNKKVFLELPHGGHVKITEVLPYIHEEFTDEDLLLDSDEFSDEIFFNLNVPHLLHRADYWRAHLDFNRVPDDFSKDGVVKTHTSQGKQIYRSETGLPREVAREIISKYYLPYRVKFLQYLIEPEITQAIFCHTMPGIGTSHSQAHDLGKPRPLFALLNYGDEDGNSEEPFATKKRVNIVAKIMEQYKNKYDDNFSHRGYVLFNDPYKKVGKSFRTEYLYGKNPFSIEINRDLFKHNENNIPIAREMMEEIVSELTRLK